jgi:hypothetical protein
LGEPIITGCDNLTLQFEDESNGTEGNIIVFPSSKTKTIIKGNAVRLYLLSLIAYNGASPGVISDNNTTAAAGMDNSDNIVYLKDFTGTLIGDYSYISYKNNKLCYSSDYDPATQSTLCKFSRSGYKKNSDYLKIYSNSDFTNLNDVYNVLSTSLNVHDDIFFQFGLDGSFPEGAISDSFGYLHFNAREEEITTSTKTIDCTGLDYLKLTYSGLTYNVTYPISLTNASDGLHVEVFYGSGSSGSLNFDFGGLDGRVVVNDAGTSGTSIMVKNVKEANVLSSTQFRLNDSIGVEKLVVYLKGNTLNCQATTCSTVPKAKIYCPYSTITFSTTGSIPDCTYDSYSDRPVYTRWAGTSYSNSKYAPSYMRLGSGATIESASYYLFSNYDDLP